MNGVVYHFTDTARLPWILLDGELRPGRNRIGGFPDPDFIWATTRSAGDRTAAGAQQAYRDGRAMLVRIELEAGDFTSWPGAALAYPAWTAEHVARLEAAARGQSDPKDWRCRAQPLARDRWRGISVRSYRDPAWSQVSQDVQARRGPMESAIVTLAGREFGSRQYEGPGGVQAYELLIIARTRR